MNKDEQRLQKLATSCKENHRKLDDLEDFLNNSESIYHNYKLIMKKKKSNHQQENKPVMSTPPTKVRNSKNDKINARLSEIKMSFASTRRRIENIASAVKDFSCIIDLTSNVYPKLETKNIATTFSDTSKIISILTNKENRLKSKISKIKTIKNNLKQKQYELNSQKKTVERRMEIAQNSITEKSLKNDIGSNYGSEYEITHFEEGSDLTDDHSVSSVDEQQYDEIEEQNIHNLIVTNQQRREQIEEKISEFQFIKQKYLIQRKTQLTKNSSKQNYSNNVDESRSSQEDDIQSQEKYALLITKQKLIEEENKSIDILIINNNRIRNEIETKYETKLRKITELADENSVIEKLIIESHQIKDQILILKEELSRIQNKTQKINRQQSRLSIMKSTISKDKDELERRSLSIENKKKLISENERLLNERRNKYEASLDAFEQASGVVIGKNTEVEQMEKKITDLENKIDEVNEEAKRRSGVVDNLLLEASSTRADTRIQHLKEILDSRSGSEIIDIRNKSSNSIIKTDEHSIDIESELSLYSPKRMTNAQTPKKKKYV